MAGVLAQNGFNLILESVQHIQRNECLDGAGKSTAVYAVGALAGEQFLTQSQRNGHFLVHDAACRSNVLEVHP